MSKTKRLALSEIKGMVEEKIATDPETPDRSCVDIIMAAHLKFIATKCGNEPDEGMPFVFMPHEIEERYERLYAEWKRDGNFPWVLKTVVVDGKEYYLGYVSDTGLPTFKHKHLFERYINLYPVDQIDADA